MTVLLASSFLFLPALEGVVFQIYPEGAGVADRGVNTDGEADHQGKAEILGSLAAEEIEGHGSEQDI